MQELNPDPQEGHDSIDKRDVRALTEYMTTIPIGGDVFSVTTQSGSEYRVDAREGRCTCPDAEYNLDDDEMCKHERRVHFATGDWTIPPWVNTDAVDPQLGEHVESNPRMAASDGGVVLEGDDDSDDDGRPDDCECVDWNTDVDLPCWPCYREGYEQPASND